MKKSRIFNRLFLGGSLMLLVGLPFCIPTFVNGTVPVNNVAPVVELAH